MAESVDPGVRLHFIDGDREVIGELCHRHTEMTDEVRNARRQQQQRVAFRGREALNGYRIGAFWYFSESHRMRSTIPLTQFQISHPDWWNWVWFCLWFSDLWMRKRKWLRSDAKTMILSHTKDFALMHVGSEECVLSIMWDHCPTVRDTDRAIKETSETLNETHQSHRWLSFDPKEEIAQPSTLHYRFVFFAYTRNGIGKKSYLHK
jgi:hypothetical protein